MNILITIIEFLIFLGLLIFIHELGHFLVSRLFKIEIEEFGFGYPPRMLKLFNLGGTDFTLNWIPFGGFVRPKAEFDPDVPGGMAAAKPLVRIAILVGGPLMNLIAGIFLFSIVFSSIGIPNSSIVEIIDVNKNAPAYNAGLQAGDTILFINDIEIDSMQKLSNIVQENLGQEISITFQRDEEIITITATPRVNPPPSEGSLGIIMGNPYNEISFIQAIPMSMMFTYEQARMLVTLPAMLIQNQITPEDARVVGPKGMFDLYQQARTRDIETTQSNQTDTPAVNSLALMAIISVALGITNLLPIPALDGGRILFVLPELIFRKRVPQEYENFIHLIGFAAMIALLIYITTQDFINPIVAP